MEIEDQLNLLQQELGLIQQEAGSIVSSAGNHGSSGGASMPSVGVESAGSQGSSNGFATGNFGSYQSSQYQSTQSGFGSQGFSIQPGYNPYVIGAPTGNSISAGQQTRRVIAGYLVSAATALDNYSHLGDIDNSPDVIAQNTLAILAFVGVQTKNPEVAAYVAAGITISFAAADLASDALARTAIYLNQQ